MRPYHLVSSPTQFQRLKKLAYKAAVDFGVVPHRIKPIDHWENTTFLITGENASGRVRRYLARIHRPGYNSAEKIEAELAFLRHIKTASDLLVPDPLLTQSGRPLVTHSARGVPEARHVSMFPFYDGHTLDHSRKNMAMIGAVLGRLHAFTDQNPRDYGPRDRFFKGIDADHEKKIQLLRTHIEKHLPADRVGAWQGAIDQVMPWIDEHFPRNVSLPLIHADLHPGNIVAKYGRQPAIIDFDDCVYGPKELDIATSLLGSQGEKYKTHRQDFMAAYRMHCAASFDEEAAYKYLPVLRLIWLGGWICGRTDNPKLYARVPRILKWMDETLDEVWR